MPNDIPAWQNTSDNGVSYLNGVPTYDANGAYISDSGGCDISGGGINTGGASGGFVLYPSKPNLNMMNRVYSK